jgi:hypothetical protein
VLINLVPEFLAVLQANDRLAAYHRYIEAHGPILTAYWQNYVLDLDSPQVDSIIQRAVSANRTDLETLLESTDLSAMAEDTIARTEDLLEIDRPTDTYLMVGVGGANAGELVVGGRGIAFVCLEHFTGRANPETYGMGQNVRLMPLWLAHELAHTVRYTATDSASAIRRFVHDAGGYYNPWQTGSRVPLKELLLNEGLAVHAAQAVVPGFTPADYFGYAKRHYNRLRELEAFLRRSAEPDLERPALGLKLRYLTSGMSTAARLVQGRVIPERAGYYLGYRMAAALVQEQGIARALRASSEELLEADEVARGIRTA